jgi:hypothetical protein
MNNQRENKREKINIVNIDAKIFMKIEFNSIKKESYIITE